MSVVLRRTVFDNGDWRFDNLSGSHHQSRVKDCCQSNVLTPVCLHGLVSFAVMLRSIAPIATPPTSMRLAKTSQLDWLNTDKWRGKAMSTITLLNITDLWTTLLTGTAQCLTYSTNYLQRLTLESWFTNLEQTPLNRCQPLPAPYKRLIHDINITNEPNRTT